MHDGVAFSDGHEVQDVAPHDVTALFETHAPPQLWKPVLQTKPHAPPALHVALALAGATHGVQEVPQVAGSALLAHAPPQTWKFVSHASWQVFETHVS